MLPVTGLPVDEQLELLFEEPPAVPERPAADPAPNPDAEPNIARNIPPTAIPARCPVVGKAVCYYADCRHWSGGGCAHPEAVRPRRRRRR